MSSPEQTRSSVPDHNVSAGVIHAIWGVSELLEPILIHLPIKDLLLDQRVCRSWHEIISASPSLQRALFLRSDTQDTKSASLGEAGEETKTVPNVNQLLFSNFTMFFSDAGITRISSQDWARTARQPAFLYCNASWRRMLITQPPQGTYEEVVEHLDEDLFVYNSQVRTLSMPDGMRMGYIYDKAEASLREMIDTKSITILVLPGGWDYRGCVFFEDGLEGRNDHTHSEYWKHISEDRPWGGNDRLTFLSIKDSFAEDADADGPPIPPNKFASQGREHPSLEFTSWERLPLDEDE